MLITLVSICFCLAIKSHAEIISSNDSTTSIDQLSPTSSASSSYMEKELAKLSSTCVTPRDHELLTGDNTKYRLARLRNAELLSKGSSSIGLAEIRRTLNFGPLRPWRHYNSTRPSEEELASAPSIEEYYNLVEPIPSDLNLDDKYHFEKNVITAVAYMDKRWPSIRKIYRHRFEKMHRLNHGLINRQSIKRMADEWKKIDVKIGGTLFGVIHSGYCQDYVKKMLNEA